MSLSNISLWLLLLLALRVPAVDAVVTCNATHNLCEELLWKGSQCKNGYCTNPFQGGCLKSMLQEEEYAEKYMNHQDPALELLRQHALSTQRICNSEDEPSSPFCQPNKNLYQEVRIFPQNWESTIATAWIQQIILSEILNVPTTTETGVKEQNNNFYNDENRMDFGLSDSHDGYQSFQNAFDAKFGDCTVLNRAGNGGVYFPCAHFMPEMWTIDLTVLEQQWKGLIERPHLAGPVGKQGWYITEFSIESDPSLGSFRGYQGEENRQKLAARFKRPTKWRDYCSIVSATNCSVPDVTAKRAPAEDGSEDERYFVEGSYMGYFRATDENNCTKTAFCTGHYLDYPCTWTSHFRQQSHHLRVALKSGGSDARGGYNYSESVEIWYAANWTKSDVIGYWWKPTALIAAIELAEVNLPDPTVMCLDARVKDAGQCVVNGTFGDAVGSCDEPPIGVRKTFVANMRSNIEQSRNPRTAMSPAYEFLSSFEINELHINDFLSEWNSRKIDKDNFDLRFATCKWVADNLEHVQRFIPPSHPRAFDDTSLKTHPVSIAAMVISSLAICVTAVAAVLATEKLQCRAVSNLSIRKKSQIEFVCLLLAGVFMVSVGALLMAIPSSDVSCTASVWFINVGYTLTLVPILVRVSAIIKVCQAAHNFKRVSVNKKRLIQMCMGISFVVIVFLAVWTGVDRLRVEEELAITKGKSKHGETVVAVSYFCKSNLDVWIWLAFAWQALLIVGATFLAVQMKSAPKSVRERSLALMIYTSSIGLVLRVAIYLFSTILSGDSLTQASLQKVESILWSLDSVGNICIYFSQFFLDQSDGEQRGPTSALGQGMSMEYLKREVKSLREQNGVLQKQNLQLTSIGHGHNSIVNLETWEEEKLDEDAESLKKEHELLRDKNEKFNTSS